MCLRLQSNSDDKNVFIFISLDIHLEVDEIVSLFLSHAFLGGDCVKG